MKRDLSGYKGIEFYAKSYRSFNAFFAIHDENLDDSNNYDRWVTSFHVKDEWEKYRIDFSELGIGKKFSEDRPGGDRVLNLSLVSFFDFAINKSSYDIGMEGKLWIDEIKFY